ncbi:MAG: ATP-binding protein [Desulforhopalus sp.]|nr:ATP-binding protein [Desulforhopalus sp.]
MLISRAASSKSRNLLLSFSPWMLAIACSLLLLLLILFTVSNYRREKELMGEALVQKGLTLMRFINSAARESIRDSLRSADTPIRWQDQIKAAMEQAVEQPGVETVLLIDREGKVFSGAGVNAGDGAVDQETLELAKSLKHGGPTPFVSRFFEDIRQGTTNQRFQIVAWHIPPNVPGRFADLFERGPGRGQMMRRFANNPHFTAMQEEMQRMADKELLYVVELDFEQFNSSLRRQLLQIIILSIVTLLVGLGGTLSFITLRGLRGSQQSLGEMRAFTDILVSSLPVGLIATDSQGVIRVCNGAAGEILGLDVGRIKGKNPEICLPAGLARMFAGDVSGEQGERQKEILLDSDPKKPMTLSLASIVVRDADGGLAGEVLLIRDLTGVKLLEKELQRSERLAALGKMAAGVAHELRNPLSSIKGLAMLLQSQVSATGCSGENAEILVKEVERLNRSIGELLDYARPGQLKKEQTRIGDIIEKTVSLVQVDAESYNISITVGIAEDLPEACVDPDKLKQVLLNLLLNAIQAMPDGGSLTVKAQLESGMIVVIIRDNGIGIVPDNLQRVFDPYFTTKSTGTGLGLALSAKIVEEHGGTIKIASVESEYTEVRVTLPVGEEDSATV